MAVPSSAMNIPTKSQDGFVEFYNQCLTFFGSNWNLRENLRKMDLAYMREVDRTYDHRAAKIANRYGDSNKLQNITIPVILPQVETAVSYQTAVFLTGNPIFGVVASPQYMDQAMQMETLIDESAIRGGWTAEFMKAFRDGFKYNLMGLEVSWDRIVTPAFDTDPLYGNGQQGKPKEIIWSGNKLKHLSLYNSFWDTRKQPCEVSRKGEFAGYHELMSRIELKDFINKLPDKLYFNITKAFESGSGMYSSDIDSINSFYVPQLNEECFIDVNNAGREFNWTAWAQLTGIDSKIQYKNSYLVTTLYARIMPSDFNLKVSESNTPQIWKLIFINGSVVIYAERMTNAHNNLPMLFSQPLDDGLGYQTKSLAKNVQPIQDVTSGMWNSVIAARRRAVSDRGIYDPSKVSEAHINSVNPAAKIPLRPAGYGKNPAEAYYAIPFRDDQSGLIMQETANLIRMGDTISGHNQAQQGQFVKGNKTLREFESVMANANGRDQMCAILIESQLMVPLKEIIKINILQYQGGVELYNRNTQQQVKIDPIALRKAVLEFKVSDGLIPTEKLISGDTLKVAMQMIGSSSQIAQEYNIGPLFSYLIKTDGGDITAFEKSPEQKTYEQALGAWQQTVLQLAKEGVTPDKYPPQPVPQQYGYEPNPQKAAQIGTKPAASA
jgi:hypothetical protein